MRLSGVFCVIPPSSSLRVSLATCSDATCGGLVQRPPGRRCLHAPLDWPDTCTGFAVSVTVGEDGDEIKTSSIACSLQHHLHPQPPSRTPILPTCRRHSSRRLRQSSRACPRTAPSSPPRTISSSSTPTTNRRPSVMSTPLALACLISSARPNGMHGRSSKALPRSRP